MTQISTYCTLIKHIAPEQDAMLNAYAALMGKVERKLYAAMQSPDFNRNETKTLFLRRFGVTGRQYNSVRMFLEGKLRSRKEALKNQQSELKSKIKVVSKTVSTMTGKVSLVMKTGAQSAAIKREAFRLHHKKRHLDSLTHRLADNMKKLERDVVPMCFGGRKLQNAQHHRQQNGFENHEEWLTQWQLARDSVINVVGSKDESWGNQSARLISTDDGVYSLHLRLPDALGGESIELRNIQFDYGADVIARATESNRQRQHYSQKPQLDKLKALRPEATKNELLADYGQAMTVKLSRHKYGWQIAVTVEEPVEQANVIDFTHGSLGVDVNADHLAVAVVDNTGNYVYHEYIPVDLSVTDATSSQRAAAIGEAAKDVVALAKRYGVGIAHERLDFKVKKSTLREQDGKKLRTVLSAFSYRKVLTAIVRRAYRHGIKTESVDPKLTSIIGSLKYANSKLTSHQSAAMVIARRGLGLIKERLCFVFTTKHLDIVNALQATESMPVDSFRRWVKIKQMTSVKPKRKGKLSDTNVSVKVNPFPVLLTA